MRRDELRDHLGSTARGHEIRLTANQRRTVGDEEVLPLLAQIDEVGPGGEDLREPVHLAHELAGAHDAAVHREQRTGRIGGAQ